MNSFIEYMIRSGLALTLFYLFYWLIMRNGTHFRLNRAILLFSVIISLILPLVSYLRMPHSFIADNIQPFTINFGKVVWPAKQITTIPENAFDLWKIITIIYMMGVFVALARLIYQAIYLQAVSRLSDQKKKDGFTIVSMNTDTIPFSYFKRIYLPVQRIDEISLDSIITHEKSHMMQRHYVDLFFIEVIAIFQWFNPVVWLYERSLKEVHEYLADAAVLDTGENRGKYQAILVNQAMGGPVFIFTNQFNKSLIKKRISMMNKLKNSRMAQLKSLYVVPLVATLLVAFTNPQLAVQARHSGGKVKVTGIVTERTTGEGVPGVAVVIKGTTEGTITGTGGEYSIEVSNENSSLVYSFVGYRTQDIPVGSNTKINVELEIEALALDFSQDNKWDAPEQAKQTTESHENAYVIVEENPSYPGGTNALLKFLMSNMRYPEVAKKNGVQGTVLVQYVIDTKGKVKDAKVMRGITPEIDQEALRLTNLIDGWRPAKQNGKCINRVVTMPITFSL